MTVELLAEHHLKFLSLKEAVEAHPSLHMPKCHIVGNHIHWLISMCPTKCNSNDIVSR